MFLKGADKQTQIFKLRKVQEDLERKTETLKRLEKANPLAYRYLETIREKVQEKKSKTLDDATGKEITDVIKDLNTYRPGEGWNSIEQDGDIYKKLDKAIKAAQNK